MKGHKKTTGSGQVVCFLWDSFPLDVQHVGSISSGQIILSWERTAPGHGIAMAMGMDISIMKPMVG